MCYAPTISYLVGDNKLIGLKTREVGVPMFSKKYPGCKKKDQVKIASMFLAMGLILNVLGCADEPSKSPLTKTVIAEGLGTIPEEALADDPSKIPSTQTVIAEGVGITPEEALKDAFRSAVRQVVGALVDGETLVKDDEVVSDKVLTFSNGFIKQYSEMSKIEAKGLIRIKIKAQVERKDIFDKLKAANVKVKEIDGKGLFAEAITDLEREKDAGAILKKTLEGFPLNCMTVSVLGDLKIVEKNDEKATVSFKVQVEPNIKAYKVFVQKLNSVLEKVAVNKNERGNFLVVSRAQVEGPWSFDGLKAYRPNIQGNYEGRADPRGGPAWAAAADNANFEGGSHAWRWMPKYISGDQDWGDQKLIADKIAVAICTHSNTEANRLEYNYFVLDKSLQPLFFQIASIQPQVKVQVENNSGNIVITDRFKTDVRSDRSIFEGNFTSAFSMSNKNHVSGTLQWNWHNKRDNVDYYSKNTNVFFVSPVFLCDSINGYFQYCRKLQIERKLTLSLEELKSVQKIKVEVLEQ